MFHQQYRASSSNFEISEKDVIERINKIDLIICIIQKKITVYVSNINTF